MKRIFPVLISLSALCASLLIQARQPNIVIFLADDQGWGDLSIHGNTNLSTPNIDSLAKEGVEMKNFYVHAVCAPTRAEFLTGRYYPRTGVSGVSTGQERLNPDETTIADTFKAAGYATGAFGKWHNGTQSPYHPNDRGFDEYYGFTSGHWGHYFSPHLDHNGKRVRGNGFVVDDFTDHAIEFIENNRKRPFFCYIPYNTPHTPFYVPDDDYAKFDGVDPKMRHRDPEREDILATRGALALCENIDDNVGRVLAKIDALGLRNDTIVIYFSDNGPNSYRWNDDMKGRKGAIDEGGIRSPFFIRWPGSLPAGKSVNTVTGAIDLLPTLAELAGIPLTSTKTLDGRSFRGLLLGDNSAWKARPFFSIRNKDVSVRTQRFRLDADGQLFDIPADRGQRHNVADQHPEVVKRLAKLAKQHNEVMQKNFAANANRPYTVGYAAKTPLMARDGVAHGSVERSVKSPNNSFFQNWKGRDGYLTWDIDVAQAGNYEAIIHYTCAPGDIGAVMRLSAGGANVQATVTEVFDPPLWDKSKERVPPSQSHYYYKDFKPLDMGLLKLEHGRATLRLDAVKIPGAEAIDVHSVELNRVN